MMQVSGDCWILKLGETQWSPGERLPQPTAYAAQVTTLYHLFSIYDIQSIGNCQ